MPQRVLTFDLRHPARFGTSGADVFGAALDIIEWADEHGFRRVAIGEHHQSPDGYLPAPLVFAAAIGGRTRRIRVQVSVLLGPLYDPVRLAEEIAVADLCLRGRLEPAVASGYVEADFHLFDVDFASRGQAMEELVPFLRLAWRGEPFEHRGRVVRVTPRPCQDPMPIYLGGGTRRTIERAARLADGWIAPGGGASWDTYRGILTEMGRPDPGPFPETGPMFLWVTADDKRRTLRWLEPHIRHQVDSYSEWAGGTGTWSPYTHYDPEEALAGRGSYQVLDPDEAIQLADRLGRRGWMMFNPLMGGIEPARAWEMLRLVERDVLPAIDASPGRTSS